MRWIVVAIAQKLQLKVEVRAGASALAPIAIHFLRQVPAQKSTRAQGHIVAD